MMRETNLFVIHCADTYPDMDIGADDIRKWHVEERLWSDIGYHYVIKRDGSLEMGRDITIPGAHVAGKNSNSIGCCLVGGKSRDDGCAEDNFTELQYRTLHGLIDVIMRDFDLTKDQIVGHNELSGKECPSFDVRYYMDKFEEGGEPC